ncbi:SCP2 domain-containing protein [Motiliproteus sp. SC1-56]|uniref:ubiquinone anaerobic biosynthesis accessory factor UbiT n=1 Tax=Motiliproteus sp. SC1-56 TaxID=2799565 RepID=UPI001A8C103B|nr:SCP2 sterol-binding domain-containing protein [Motiliproteus sp. SC1-56]
MLKFPTLPQPSSLEFLPSPAELARRLPLMLVRQSRRLPFALQRAALLKMMEQAFAEPLEDGDFEFLEGKWMKVEISDLDLRWYFSCSEEGQLIVSQEEEADACIRGNLKEFLLLASRSEDPDTLFFQRRLMIEGDTEVGLEVKNLMDAVDHDSLPPFLRLLLTRGTGLANRLL